MNDLKEIERKLTESIKEVLNIQHDIRLSDKLLEDLNVDSLSLILIAAEMEKETNKNLLESIFIQDREDITVSELALLIYQEAAYNEDFSV